VWANAVVAGLFGLLIGSFLNVVIYRVPRRESLVAPGSRCPTCETSIRPYDNVPVLSWLILRGRCRSCAGSISPRYPAVELVTGLLFAGAGLRFRDPAAVAAFCVFFAVLVALSGIDLDHKLIPIRVLYPGLALSVALLAVASATGPGLHAARDAAIGGAIGFGSLFAIHMIQPRGMGFGDVRLAGYVALNTGWLGVADAGVALLSAFLLGSAVGLSMVVARRATRSSRIPFGPFLAAGGVVAVFWGPPIVRVWLG
jgi:leader peptidase (prepilin peptidase)/N-methyltransferase